MPSNISAHDFLSHLNHFWASKPFPQLTRGESSWSDSAYVSKVKPSTCTHMCIVVICLQNSLRFKNKQLIELSALSALSQSLSTSRSKNTNYHFLYWMFLKLVTFQHFVAHLSLLEWLLPPKRARGRSTIIWASKAITDWKTITDWTRLLRGASGSGSIIREKSGEFHFKWDERISEKSRSR